jgi:hypothetical protein
MCLLQDFLVATSQLALARTQQAALSLVDSVEELALIANFVQANGLAIVCNMT